MIDENEVYSHAIWKNLYEGRDANIHKVEIPDAAERAWFTEKYPLFKKLYEPFWEAADDGEPLQLNTTFLHCKVCQFPMLFVDADNQPVVHAQTHNDKQHYFCSEPCKWIFNLEPDKYTRVFTQDEIFAQGIVEADDLTNFWAVGRADNGQLKRD